MHHHVVHHHLRAKRMRNALVPEAHAHQRQLRAEGLDNLIGQTRLARRAGAGRDEDALGLQGLHLIERDFVIAMHLHIHVFLAKILHEVKRKRIVVVDDEEHGGQTLALRLGLGKSKSSNCGGAKRS